MVCIGIIREEKNPPDTRVALTPEQCRHIVTLHPQITILVEPSPNRCFPDEAYEAQGIAVTSDLSSCDIFLGIKEVPVDKLIEGKSYLFFSHTKKKQPYNKALMQSLIQKRIRMIDYECLTHSDGQRILGFGFYAGIIGAHNGLLTYGRKWSKYDLKPAYACADFSEMVAQYQDIRLPAMKVVITGSGKVAAGAVEIMNRFDVEFVEPEDFLLSTFDYPVFTHLKGHNLYVRKDNGSFFRDDFHRYPEHYQCLFSRYLAVTDVILNGVYWEQGVPRLFESQEIKNADYRAHVIADITCDIEGSIPINVGASSIADPVYGIRRTDFSKTAPFQPTRDVVDIMAVDNLPNELPCDASTFFGQHFEKFILPELIATSSSDIIARGTICENGKLTPFFEYLADYAYE